MGEQICTDILTNIISSLINHKDFLEIIQQIVTSPQSDPSWTGSINMLDDPVPYWAQIVPEKNDQKLGKLIFFFLNIIHFINY